MLSDSIPQLPDSVEVAPEEAHFKSFTQRQIPEKFWRDVGGERVKSNCEYHCKVATGSRFRYVCRDSGCCYTEECRTPGNCSKDHLSLTARQRFEAAKKAGLSSILIPKSS